MALQENTQTATDGPASGRGNDEVGQSSRDLVNDRASQGQWSGTRPVRKHVRKNTGGIFDRFIKSIRPLAQVATPIIIAIVGSWYNCATQKQHDSQTAVQILNQREQSELLARSTVFDKPIAGLLDKNKSIGERMLALETFLYNFHGVINVRNLFTDLENEIEESDGPDLRDFDRTKLVEQSTRLQLIAQGVVHAQKQMLAAAMPDGSQVDCREGQNADRKRQPSIVTVVLNKTKICTISYPEGRGGEHKHTLKLNPLCVGKHTLLESKCPTSPSPQEMDPFSTSARIRVQIGDKPPTDPFELTKFGTPFSDNAIIDHGHRVALLLRSISADHVELEVLAFPKDLVPPGYQPTITNISRLLGGESG